MTDESQEANATADTEEVVTDQSEPMTLEQIRSARLAQMSPQQETTEAVEETEVEDTEEEPQAEEETEEVESEDSGEDVLSQIDWDALDDESKAGIAEQAIETLPPEQLAELAKKMGSGSGKRIGELTGQIRELKNQIEAKDKALKEGLEALIPPSNNFANVDTEDKLTETSQKIREEIKFYQRWLAGDDDYYQSNGQEYSRSDIVQYVESLQDQYDDVPKQKEYIRSLEKSRREADELQKKADKEFSWITDESSKAYSLYDELVSSPDMAVIENIAPSLGAKLKYHLLHTANSMAGMTIQPSKKITLPRRSPNSVIDSTGSASPKDRGNIQIKKLREQAMQGNLDSARRLRTLQIQNRK
jgi:hypothetical protein